MATLTQLDSAGAFIVRHRWRFIDSTLVVLLTAGVLYVGLAYDIFANAPGATVRSEALELDELLLVCGVLTVGAVWATSRLLRERRAHRARRAIEAEMRALAYSDALTGLPNRRRFDEALAAAAAAPPRAGGSHAVLMMDLNGFKRVNDAFGHGVGDELLMQVAARLRRIVREGDLAARLGGDEFAILSPHTAGPEAATGLALRVIEALEQPVLAGGVEHRIGAAVGLSLTPQDGADPEDLVRKADIALYRAKEDKHTKGSALRFFEPDMDAHVRERAVIERELTAAVAAGSVRPLFQPLVALGSHAVVGFEALPRWTSPVLGEVPPERFIAVAEDCGLIARLTDQLLEQACTAAATWPAHVELSFNVSGALLHDRTFGLRVLATLARAGLAPGRLELEITESALVRDLAAARAVLGGLRKAGVRIALDDFGTGYSSLYHLRNFELDRIKIDRSFVDLMAVEPGSAAIVRALVGLGSGLGLKVTAEGVETAEQERLLQAEGCDDAQGVRYGQAITAEEAAVLMTASAPMSRAAG